MLFKEMLHLIVILNQNSKPSESSSAHAQTLKLETCRDLNHLSLEHPNGGTIQMEAVLNSLADLFNGQESFSDCDWLEVVAPSHQGDAGIYSMQWSYLLEYPEHKDTHRLWVNYSQARIQILILVWKFIQEIIKIILSHWPLQNIL